MRAWLDYRPGLRRTQTHGVDYTTAMPLFDLDIVYIIVYNAYTRLHTPCSAYYRKGGASCEVLRLLRMD